jgi:hypothetical protein
VQIFLTTVNRREGRRGEAVEKFRLAYCYLIKLKVASILYKCDGKFIISCIAMYISILDEDNFLNIIDEINWH